jgi:hypothetical protein
MRPASIHARVTCDRASRYQGFVGPALPTHSNQAQHVRRPTRDDSDEPFNGGRWSREPKRCEVGNDLFDLTPREVAVVGCASGLASGLIKERVRRIGDAVEQHRAPAATRMRVVYLVARDRIFACSSSSSAEQLAREVGEPPGRIFRDRHELPHGCARAEPPVHNTPRSRGARAASAKP